MHMTSSGRGMRAARALAAAAIVAVTLAACSSQEAAPGAAPAARDQAPAAPAGPVVKLLEPQEGSFSGHVDTFRWSQVDGADGYRLTVTTLSGRVVWESPVLTTAEAHLPNTVALEPEGHTWVVVAMKGADVLATSPTGRFTVTP